MKKKLFLFFTLLFIFSYQAITFSTESKVGGIEISGNIDVVIGYQHDDSKSFGTNLGGQLGYFRGNTAPRRDTFNFYLDQVEIDLNKQIGEKARLRVDLDFGRLLSGSGRNTDTAFIGSNFEIEQAYLTLNLKGVELALGQFTIPMGYYSIDRSENPTLSFSPTFNLIPGNLLGAKLFYTFNERFDLNLYVVNSLANGSPFGSGTAGGTTHPGGINQSSALPSYGMRFGFNWGKEEKKNTFGIAYAGGPERFGCHGGTTPCNRHLTHIVSFDLSYQITPSILLAADGVYRQDNSELKTVSNDRAFSAFALIDYSFNELWHFYFRYGFLQDRTGFYLGSSQNLHDFAIGAGYQISDGAKVKLEYNPIFFDPRNSGFQNSFSHAISMEFSYFF